MKYRSAERAAPLGLLDLILDHVDDPAAVLDLWARDHGFRVVPAVEDSDQLRDAAEALRRAADALEQVAGPEKVPIDTFSKLRVVGR